MSFKDKLTKLIVNLHSICSQKKKIVEIISGICGDTALKLLACSYAYFDKGDCCHLINLKYAKSIDGIGINVLENLTNRGICIRLFSVSSGIRKILKMSGNEDTFKIYNEVDSQKAVSMFEEEILEQGMSRDDVRKRNYLRVEAFFKADFKYYPGHNGVIAGRATILDLSEGGMFAEQVLAMDEKTEDIITPEKLTGHELYDMKFRLNIDSIPIKTRGKCVREFRDEGKLSAGIRFKGMGEGDKETIREYVQESLQNEVL